MADTLEQALLEAALIENLSAADQKALVINLALRTIVMPEHFLFGVYNDKDVLKVPFVMPRYYNSIDLSEFSINVNYKNSAGYGNVYRVTEPEVTDTLIRFNWILGRGVFVKEGFVYFVICLRQLNTSGEIEREFNTTIARASVLKGLEVDENPDPIAYSILANMEDLESRTQTYAGQARSEYVSLSQLVNTATTYLTAMLGAPRTAQTVSAMTDTDKVYVYTGNEVGFTFGHWYYYDGSNWTDGGTYNSTAFDTDESLATPKMAADSKATGDAITSVLIKANNNENEIATLATKVSEVEAELQNVSIDPNDLGLEQDSDTYYVYPTYKGVRSENGIPLATGGGGGGGGGGEVIDAKFTCTNTSGWLSKTIATGSSCVVSFDWSSIENELPTGDGTLRISVNEIVRATYQIQQGSVTADLAPFLTAGTNKVKVRVSDTYDQGKTTTFTITSIALSISSTFDNASVYGGAISFPFTPVGAVEKTIYFIVDNQQVGTQVTSVSGRQMSYIIPAQTHGAHSIKVYFESVINNETVRSNGLYYEVTCIESGNSTTIITSSYHKTTEQQYSSIVIPYRVYDPTSFTAEAKIYANNVLLSTQTVDRTEQSYTYRADVAGSLTIKIESGEVYKEISLTVTELDIDVEAETEGLELYLSSYGRSNQEEHPDTWVYGTGANAIEAAFTNFNFTSDGWQSDKDGVSVLRVSGDARLTIPLKVFENDFRGTGKTIELEFATRNVLDYDATILSCMSGGRGLSVTAQKAVLKSEQSEISTQYKEDEHVRISFVAEKRVENRLLFIYINGIASGVVQYPVDDDFAQVEPVNISVGSSDCTIDLYCIRVYNNDLTRHQIVDNWIADTQNGAEMLERYNHNNVYDAYGNVVIAKLPTDLPYMIVECAELPQYKGDKKVCSGSFTDVLHPSKSFTFTNAQFDVQGTSSQYYPRKNYKAKFNGGFVMGSTTVSKYAMNNEAIPTKTFTFKADVASSEGANNVELVRLYNDACPYKTPAQVNNPKVRQGIDGFPMLIFWNNTSTNETTFIGKYNFNNDKGTAEVFGLTDGDESWETLNNTSNRVIYKSADYSGTDWLNDFEARYPDTDPAYTDPSQLAEFAAWVVSTDTTAATGDTLSAPVTYGSGGDAVTYTTDSAEYRLAKFRAEAGNYMEMQSALFYYLFTELFLMVDSRAKNSFPSFIGTEVSTT